MQSQELQYIPDTVRQEDYLTPRAGSGLQQAGCDFCPQSKHTQLLLCIIVIIQNCLKSSLFDENDKYRATHRLQVANMHPE